MRITNQAVVALVVVFVVIGLIALPLDVYGMRLVQLVAMLIIGMLLTAGGAMGAGDAKFIAAAAPYVAFADMRLMLAILAACLLAAVTTHRLARLTPIRRATSHWKSWEMGKLFPMGLTLGSSLALYLGLGTIYGA